MNATGREYPHSDVLRALRRLIRAADFDAKDLARQTGLSTSRLLVLELLDSADEMTVGSIARKVGLAQGTVTTLIDRLVGRGVLSRRRANRDRRQVKVGVSDAGRALLAAAPTPLRPASSRVSPRWRSGSRRRSCPLCSASLN